MAVEAVSYICACLAGSLGINQMINAIQNADRTRNMTVTQKLDRPTAVYTDTNPELPPTCQFVPGDFVKIAQNLAIGLV